MLTGTLIHPQILEALGRAGHSAKVLIADGNYPAATKRPPGAALVSLNLSPGVVDVQVLAALAAAIPIEAAAVMRPERSGPYALEEDPEIWQAFRTVLSGAGVDPRAARPLHVLRDGERRRRRAPDCHGGGAPLREPAADDRCRDAAVKVAIVTGAAQGIGRACVDAFVADAWKIIAVDVDEERLAFLGKQHGEAVATLHGDVVQRATNQRAVEEALRRYGRLDCAVANAGINLPKLIDDTTDEEFDRLVDVNVRAPVYLAQAAHRHLADSGGNLVIVASKTGLVAQRNSPIYVATKGAAVQLARALALDWAPEGIRVNALCPGIVDTPMLRTFSEGLPDPETAWREMEKAQPLGRLARPEECAVAVLFLASAGASFITGVALPIDGGFTAE